jgi:hypothetical protein
MATWEKEVYSSNVSTVGYNDETKELSITWTKGKRSIYSGVPEELAEQLVNAPSVGSMLNAEVKPYFSHRYG